MDQDGVFHIQSDYSMEQGTMDELKTFIKKPYKSPTLDKKKEEVTTQVSKSLFGFDQIDKSKDKESEFENISEDKINKELEELGEDDFKDMASMILAGLDWLLEKALNNFFSRKQVKETAAQRKKLDRMKIIGAKIMKKHSVRFKIEMLGAFMFIGFIANRYNTSVPLTEDDKKPAPPKSEPQKARKAKADKEQRKRSQPQIVDITKHQKPEEKKVIPQEQPRPITVNTVENNKPIEQPETPTKKEFSKEVGSRLIDQL